MLDLVPVMLYSRSMILLAALLAFVVGFGAGYLYREFRDSWDEPTR